jgi:hypothetical protein
VQIGISSVDGLSFVGESLGGTFFQPQRKAFFNSTRAPQRKKIIGLRLSTRSRNIFEPVHDLGTKSTSVSLGVSELVADCQFASSRI